MRDWRSISFSPSYRQPESAREREEERGKVKRLRRMKEGRVEVWSGQREGNEVLNSLKFYCG